MSQHGWDLHWEEFSLVAATTKGEMHYFFRIGATDSLERHSCD